MSYKTLGETGTMAQSFHFEVTPEKRECPYARATNCVCMAGGKGKCTTGDCCQYSEHGCPDLAKFCCPKGMIGRPKVYPNGYRFEYTTIGARPEPWPPCENGNKANDQISGYCYDWKNYKWQFPYTLSKNARPPVF